MIDPLDASEQFRAEHARNAPTSARNRHNSRSARTPAVTPNPPSTLRAMASVKRDYYEVLRRLAQRGPGGDQEGVPPSCARAAPRRLRRARRRGALPRGRRGLRGALQAGDAPAVRPLRPRRALAPAASGRPPSTSRASGTSSRRSSARTSSARAPARGRAHGGDILVETEIELVEAAEGVTREVEYPVSLPCEVCDGTGAEPGTTPETCPTCGGSGRLQSVSNSPFGQFIRTAGLRNVRRLGPDDLAPVQDLRGRRPRARRAHGRGRGPAGNPRRPAHPPRRRGPRGHARRALRRPLRPRPRPPRRAARARRQRHPLGARPDHDPGRARRRRSPCRRSTATTSST